MTITTTSHDEFVFKYLQLFQGSHDFSHRELQVLYYLVLQYLKYAEASKKLRYEKSKKENSPDIMWRKPESLKVVTDNLKMEFHVFRGYVKKLKEKGAFVDGTINPKFIPQTNPAKVEVTWT